VLIGRSFDTEAEHKFHRLVVALDGSASGDAICAKAVGWARMFGVGLQLVTVSEQSPPPMREGDDPPHHFGMDGDPKAYLVKMLEHVCALGFVANGLTLTDPISPASRLTQLLRDEPGGILVTATHLRTGISRFVHGSIAGNILDKSSAPVLEFSLEHVGLQARK
jgi:nucleotide-binding universal stress UspA family protein